MASWKKIIVSGSDAALNSLTVSTCVVGSVCGTATNSTRLGGAPQACYVMTCGNQTIGGDKTFSCSPIIASTSPTIKSNTGLLNLEIRDGDQNEYNAICIQNVGGVSPAGQTRITFNNTGGGSAYATFCGECGVSFNTPVSSACCFVGNFCGNATTATTATTAGNSNCLGGAPQACYVMMCGDQTIAGVKTFSETVCGSGLIRAVDLCATTSICGPMVCVSGTATAGAVCSAGNVFIGGEILPINSCLIVRTIGTIRACIDAAGICTPGTVRAAHICSVGSVCGAGLNVSGDAIVGGNATVSGNLTVNGSLVYLNVTDLAVEDKFILLNSGSNVAREGGLIIDEGNPSGSGHAFIYDADTSRWGFTASLAGTATSVIPDAFAAAVVTSDLTEYQKVGNIRISGEDIFIYS